MSYVRVFKSVYQSLLQTVNILSLMTTVNLQLMREEDGTGNTTISRAIIKTTKDM